LHHTPEEALAACIGEEIASYIVQAREGKLHLEVGGGGQYGRVAKKNT
jgi:PHP family Zn ribbon phosphoesterase